MPRREAGPPGAAAPEAAPPGAVPPGAVPPDAGAAAAGRGGVPARRSCATMEVHERLLRTRPGYREARDAIETMAWRVSRAPIAERTGCTRIPVVVHVVYNAAAENISDAQIKSQIVVLNDDFRRKNADIGSVPAPFQPLIGDARLQFELATVDPNGAATNGITRTNTAVNGFGTNDAVKSAATGGADPWPSDRYLNIWVCALGGGLLGYSQFPGGPAATDGLVILHSAFGTTGTAAAPFNLGRTVTHELGHWLNLRHIWGDDGTGCSGDDFVADTPNQGGPNYGKPVFPILSCGNAPNGDMFMNYMDYVDDAAMVMFSVGQVARMQAALDARPTMGSPVSCAGGPVKQVHKEAQKEIAKEFHKEFPKDIQKDPPKDFHKDPPKDFAKDFHKDPPKDFPKDVHKDPPKEFPKDLHKDPPKELPKELHKDLHKDPVKDLHFDPSKGIFDPPKPGYDPIGGLGQGGYPPIHGGGIPFVLGTPAAVSQPQAGSRGHASAVASGYVQLLSQYAQLYAAGMLDEAGMASWQHLAALYAQVVSSGG